MGKYEAPRPAASGGKKHIGLWIALAVLLILVIWGIWFFTTPPEQNNTVGNNNVNTNQTVQPDPNVQTPVDTQPEDSTQTPVDTTVDSQEPSKEMKKGWMMESLTIGLSIRSSGSCVTTATSPLCFRTVL